MVNESFSIKGYVTVSVIRAKTGKEEIICNMKDNLLTTVGRDWIHGQVYESGTTDEAKYIGLSSNSDSPAAGDTSLTGEISTNGLQRAAGTVTHVAGTNTTTIFNQFTASGSFTAVQKTALFTAISSGTMVHENTFPAVNMESGDLLNCTWSIIGS